ncbi:hypothetical protein AB0A77_27030 [Streptomyces varsoviensis]|uniref:DUF6895 family protein n=1 Tax=Streptomyces varsoviensis TaxID=67373 RepID=UPI0033E33CBC
MTALPVRTAHEISGRALAWLHANREYGALSSVPRSDVGEEGETYKALAETALAASLVLRDGAAGTTELTLARELLDFGWRQLGEGTLLYERLLRHPLTTDPMETYAHFVRAGYRHALLDGLLAHNAALRATHACEHIPNRRLAVANASRITGHDHGAGAHDWASLTRATWLGALPEPWHIDWLTGYAVTHTVFHLTDWGRLPGGLPADIAGYLRDWLPMWTDIWAETSQWDLMAELMIVGNCLPDPATEAEDWQRLAELQHADGLVPRDDKPVDDDPAQRFEDHQHTTIVAVVAGTIAVNRALNEPGRAAA